MTQHKIFLKQALDQAKFGEGSCAPNPAVGAVLVRDGEVVAKGYHRGSGLPHAEVEALSQVVNAQGCDLYVTLEPCCHYGKTPPCTELIIKKHVSRVFFAYLDPNPVVAGQGQEQLRNSGIVCEHIELDEINTFYKPYAYWVLHKKPWVSLKLAISDKKHLPIDPLTGEACWLLTQQNRSIVDAILTTAETIACDDPRMNVRQMDGDIVKPLVILDRKLRTSINARVFNTCNPIIILHEAGVPNDKVQVLKNAGAELHAVACDALGLLDLNDALRLLGRLGYQHLWVEAGWLCSQSFLFKGLVNTFWLYIAKHREGVRTKPISWVYEPGYERDIEVMPYGEDVVFFYT